MSIDLALKATVVFAVGGMVTAAMARASAASRHAVWAAVCIAALCLPVAHAALPETGVSWWPRFSAMSAADRPAREVGAADVPTVGPSVAAVAVAERDRPCRPGCGRTACSWCGRSASS